MMIAVTVHLSAIVAPASLAIVARLLATGAKMLACAAAVWMLLALPGFLSERDSTSAAGRAALHAHR